MAIIGDNEKIINGIKELGEKLDKTNELLAGILEISQRLENRVIAKEKVSEKAFAEVEKRADEFGRAFGLNK